MAYQVKCDRCGTTRTVPEPNAMRDTWPDLPQDWQRLAMGRDRYAQAEISAQLCPDCSTLVRRFVTASPLCCEGCK